MQTPSNFNPVNGNSYPNPGAHANANEHIGAPPLYMGRVVVPGEDQSKGVAQMLKNGNPPPTNPDADNHQDHRFKLANGNLSEDEHYVQVIAANKGPLNQILPSAPPKDLINPDEEQPGFGENLPEEEQPGMEPDDAINDGNAQDNNNIEISIIHGDMEEGIIEDGEIVDDEIIKPLGEDDSPNPSEKNAIGERPLVSHSHNGNQNYAINLNALANSEVASLFEKKEVAFINLLNHLIIDRDNLNEHIDQFRNSNAHIALTHHRIAYLSKNQNVKYGLNLKSKGYEVQEIDEKKLSGLIHYILHIYENKKKQIKEKQNSNQSNIEVKRESLKSSKHSFVVNKQTKNKDLEERAREAAEVVEQQTERSNKIQAKETLKNDVQKDRATKKQLDIRKEKTKFSKIDLEIKDKI